MPTSPRTACEDDTGSVVTLCHHAGITTARQVDAQVSEWYGIITNWRSAGQMIMTANILLGPSHIPGTF